MTAVLYGVALCVVIDILAVERRKLILPVCISVSIGLTVLGGYIAVCVIGHTVNYMTVKALGKQLTQSIEYTNGQLPFQTLW